MIDSVQSMQSKNIYLLFNDKNISVLLFVYVKDGKLPGSYINRQLCFLLHDVKKRKIIVDKSSNVNLISDKSEMLIYNYFIRLKGKANFWQLTDSTIRNNRNDIAAAEIISHELLRTEINIDTIKLYFNQLSLSVKHGKFGKNIHDYIVARKFLKEGNTVKDFSLPDTLNSIVHLSDIKSSFVLLDFWFSSCVPCIKSFPEMKEWYKKYSRKQFEIIGLSIDPLARKEIWKSTVSEQQLEWINLWDHDASIAFYIFSIDRYPTRILLDKMRKIIKINPTDEEIDNLVK